MNSFFSKKYTASVLIDAPKDRVWQILAALPDYHQWNTFTIGVETEGKIGDKVILTVQMKMHQKPLLQMEYLTNYKPLEAMDWGMDWGPFLKAMRVQRLKIISPGVTEYFTEDKIWGLLCPVVHWFYGRNIQAGFERMAGELKHFSELK
jgi:hypothetical protein